MANPFQITLPQFKQFAKDQDTKNNILETNPSDKVKVVKPKWHENKWLWFVYGVGATAISVNLAGQIN